MQKPPLPAWQRGFGIWAAAPDKAHGPLADTASRGRACQVEATPRTWQDNEKTPAAEMATGVWYLAALPTEVGSVTKLD